MVELSWDEIDEVQAALRSRAFSYEAESRGDVPFMVAEADQSVAGWWLSVHRLGDVRRVANGEPAVLGGDAFEELLEVDR